MKMQRRMALRKRAHSEMAADHRGGGGGSEQFRNRNSNKNFETHSSQRTKRKKLEDDFHCGQEFHPYTKFKDDHKMEEEVPRKTVVDEEGDSYYVNWCTQTMEFDDEGHCVGQKPPIETCTEEEQLQPAGDGAVIYRIPTPNYCPTGNTPIHMSNGQSPITPGYEMSPMSTMGYGGATITHQYEAVSVNSLNGDDGLNDTSMTNMQVSTKGNTHSFTTRTKRTAASYQAADPPHKKIKTNHGHEH